METSGFISQDKDLNLFLLRIPGTDTLLNIFVSILSLTLPFRLKKKKKKSVHTEYTLMACMWKIIRTCIEWFLLILYP